MRENFGHRDRLNCMNLGGKSIRIQGLHLAAFAVVLPLLQAKERDTDKLDFVNDIRPLMSRLGCNGSSCHGKAEGQNGFRLSVFGYDPESDFHALTVEGRGRRILPSAPEQSLLLRKITGEVGHGGGVKAGIKSRGYKVILDWIAQGAAYSIEGKPVLKDLSMEPSSTLMRFGQKQKLKVWGAFSDGSKKDVTWQATFHSNDPGMAKVDETGEVTIGNLVGQASIMARFQGKVSVFRAMVPQPKSKVPRRKLPIRNFVDTLVDKNLERLNLSASEPADDPTFLRRAFLDVIGRLPTVEETKNFLLSNYKGKREKLVVSLMNRNEFADFWAMKWSDLLRVDRLKLGHEHAHDYYRWIHSSMSSNKPLDAMVREILTSEGPLKENPAGNFFRAAKDAGEMSSMTAQVFLGVRITCAECHQHPYARWTQQDFHAMRGFFQQLKTKESPIGTVLLSEGNPVIKHPRTGMVIHPYPLGESMPEESREGDRRKALAEWLTSPDNQWFSRNLANRIWAHFMGKGLTMPLDDLRNTNPPTNPELLDRLSKHLVKTGFDLKAMIRLITSSAAYGLSSKPNASNVGDESNFSRALFRRMPAEVLMDAVCDVTGVDEKFEGVPSGHRAIQLWDSQVNHYFLKLFGRPARTSVCECERVTGASIAQALHLMNSPNLQGKLSHPNGIVKRLLATHSTNDEVIRELYLRCYSREPTSEEIENAMQYMNQEGKVRQKVAEDLAWSLLNSLEFVFNH